MANEESHLQIAGFLNVDKPQGWTSSDVVGKLRASFGLRKRRIKIGHGGTLDPLATGVLPICIGFATRLSEYLLSADKTYLIGARLGIATNTYDSEGEVTAERTYDDVSESCFLASLNEFVGEFDQVPPMFSAIKLRGQPLYKLARQGKSVHREPRRVTVRSMEVLTWDPPEFEIRIECGSGFYARSFAHDVGQRLGCGAHMTSLRRERAGDFIIGDAMTIEELIAETENDVWIRNLMNPDTVLRGLDAVGLTDHLADSFLKGQETSLAHPVNIQEANLVRVYSAESVLIGLARYRPENGTLAPVKVFAA